MLSCLWYLGVVMIWVCTANSKQHAVTKLKLSSKIYNSVATNKPSTLSIPQQNSLMENSIMTINNSALIDDHNEKLIPKFPLKTDDLIQLARLPHKNESILPSGFLEGEYGKPSKQPNPILIELLKKKILTGLGLSEKPKVSKSVQIPLFMMEMYNKRLKRSVVIDEDMLHSNDSSQFDFVKNQINDNIVSNSVRSFTHSG